MGFYQKGKYKNSTQAKRGFRRGLRSLGKRFPNATKTQIIRVMRIESSKN